MSQPQPLPIDIRLMEFAANLMLLIFAGLLLTALASWIARHPVFAIRAVVVGGDSEHNNEVTLRANVGPRLTGTFFTLDLAVARQAFEAMPWVRQAVVKREFPNRLRVSLQEQQAVAYWGEDGESSLVNTQGEVFEANVGEVEQDNLPRFKGPKQQSMSMLKVYRAIRPEFEKLSLRIDELRLSERGTWQLRLDNGAEIAIGVGREEEVIARTNQFAKTLTQVTSRYARATHALESADLRHTDGYALKLAGVSTLTPGKPQGGRKN